MAKKKTEDKRKGNPTWQKGRSATPEKQFSADNQPSGKAKSEGKAAAKRGRELTKALLELTFTGAKDSPLKKAIAEYFGVPAEDLTIEMMMNMRQMEKAIQKADTFAYNAVMARAFGMPKQQTEVTGKDGQPIGGTKVVKLILPKKEFKGNA